ncbi:UNVERIFIED_CONTAM: DNA repair endonuclease UVH1 [Sesamum radiatum]|uniref:DNA repair endonuclease UVH1 n=1 Tax=Sesamum radiatum TaxID=300843 RepID=A0AAW2TYA1_SESRA
MVQFHEHIIGDLLEDPSGGIVVLSAGLGLPKLISSLLRLHDPSQGSVLILNASPAQKNSIDIDSQFSSITADLPLHNRLSLYTSGGIFFITARILIVDLLTQRLPTSSVAGIILLNAHSLSDTSTEAFIVRILRSSNRSLYVRAFSDRPHAMVSGFAKAERTLKCLFLRKLHLWPRFQEFTLDVSLSTDALHLNALSLEISIAKLTYYISNAKSTLCSERLPWHIGFPCVEHLLLVKDCIKLSLIETENFSVKKQALINSVYVSQDLERDPPEVIDIRVPMSPYMIGIQKAVIEVMDACLKEMRKTNKVDVEDLTVENGLFKSFDEIVRRQLDPIWHTLGKRTKQLVSDLKTLRKLLDYLARYDAVTYLKYLDSLRASESFRSVWIFAESSYKIFEYAKKRVYHFSRSDSGKSIGLSTGASIKKRKLCERNKDDDGDSCRDTEERQKQAMAGEELVVGDEGDQHGIILVACKDERSCMQLQDCITKGQDKVMREEWEKYLLSKVELQALPKYKKKKPKATKGFGILDGVIPSVSGQKAELSSISQQENDALLAAAYEVSKQAKGILMSKTLGPVKIMAPSTEHEDKIHDHNVSSPGHLRGNAPELQMHEQGPEITSQLPFVHFHALENSTEVRKFEASIRRENGAFESLIRQKSLMMIPVNQDEHLLSVSSSLEPQSIAAQNLVTRKAGGKKEAEKEMQIIVDMREFMSSLPNVLHQKGMHIIPVTLEVGDYILSPLMCVERKSIQDLFGSFSSGRLYHQVEMMSRYYRIPVLLIEFSQDKSFSFQSASEIGDDVTPNNIISKLSLLALHFPRLRIVWSRSLHATAEIFATLKANQDEPDEAKAIRVGVPSEDGVIENDVRAENFNTSAVEFLRRLPGVTDSNYRSIMDGCKSLAELALLPMEKLAELMGGQKAAKTLRDFLDAKYPTLL